eukprot:4456770-Pleurochrysis_carterae.AAC.1
MPCKRRIYPSSTAHTHSPSCTTRSETATRGARRPLRRGSVVGLPIATRLRAWSPTTQHTTRLTPTRYLRPRSTTSRQRASLSAKHSSCCAASTPTKHAASWAEQAGACVCWKDAVAWCLLTSSTRAPPTATSSARSGSCPPRSAGYACRSAVSAYAVPHFPCAHSNRRPLSSGGCQRKQEHTMFSPGLAFLLTVVACLPSQRPVTPPACAPRGVAH